MNKSIVAPRGPADGAYMIVEDLEQRKLLITQASMVIFQRATVGGEDRTTLRSLGSLQIWLKLWCCLLFTKESTSLHKSAELDVKSFSME